MEKLDEFRDKWIVQPVKFQNYDKEIVLYVSRIPNKEQRRRTRSTKLWVPMNKTQLKELIQELQEVEASIEEASE